MELAPDTAILYENGVEKRVEGPVELGQHILIKPGSRIPLDGTVVKRKQQRRRVYADRRKRPSRKGTGDTVIGGSMNYNGAMEVEVTRTGSDTTLSKIIKMIEDAQGKKRRFPNWLTRWRGYLCRPLWSSRLHPLFCGLYRRKGYCLLCLPFSWLSW